jgi:peptidoglycan/LPS O-acetylase OafA/YrhL
MVLVSHAGAVLSAPAIFGAFPFGQVFRFGRSGVDFFFVLSGFLIALLHWDDIGRPTRLRRFAVRRLTRIYPTYWLVLALIVPADLFSHTLFDDYDQPWAVAKGILLLPQARTILDVTWSLRNELLFYALFGLLIFRRNLGFAVAGLWVTALLAVALFDTSPKPDLPDGWRTLLTFPMNVEFLIGVLAGWAFGRMTFPRPHVLLGLGLVLFAALWAMEDQLWFMFMPWRLFLAVSAAYGLAAVLVIGGLCTLEREGRLRMPRALVTLGGASYLLYLIHVPGLLILGASERHLHLTRWVPLWLLAAAFILVIIAGAIGLHATIEKPVLRWVRRVLGNRTDARSVLRGSQSVD